MIAPPPWLYKRRVCRTKRFLPISVFLPFLPWSLVHPTTSSLQSNTLSSLLCPRHQQDDRLDCLQLSSLFSCNPKSWILFPGFCLMCYNQIWMTWSIVKFLLHPIVSFTVSDVKVRTLINSKNLHQSWLLKQNLNLPSLFTPVHLCAAMRSYSIIARVYEALSTISTIHTCKSSRGSNIFGTGGLVTI